jgi:CrcB protein
MKVAGISSVLLVGAGGFVGSVLRFLVGGLVQSALPASTFPYGTLVVNVAGCFAIGGLSELVEAHGGLGSGARAFVLVGVLGGFTTFSAFGNETVNLVRDGQRLAAGLNVCSTLALALGAVWLGRSAAQAIWR